MFNERENSEFGDPSESMITIEGPSAMSAATAAEVDVQITTAKRYPRSIKAFKDQALQMATFDEETASGCFYSLPRGGKPIEGPSARLAEIVLSAWGNVRADARVIGVDDKEITAEAMTWDLEKNVAVRVQVKRRITNKSGQRFNDDMITVTGNAACSIALRNSVFKVIPMVYTKSVYQEARRVAIGDVQTLAAKRGEMVAYFGKMGVTPDRVFAAIGKANIEEIGLDELATLKGVATAIKDGDVTVDDAFPPVLPSDSAAGVNGLKERLDKNKTAEAPQPAEPITEAPQAVEEPAAIEPEADETKAEETAEASTEEEKPATDEKPLSKAESQKVDQIAWINEFEKESDDNAERVARVLEDRKLEDLTPGQVKDIFNELQK